MPDRIGREELGRLVAQRTGQDVETVPQPLPAGKGFRDRFPVQRACPNYGVNLCSFFPSNQSSFRTCETRTFVLK
jgi:hypothetical protein